MEIKATLDKPYEERDKMNFIILNNYNLGYEIRETQTALQAWGYTEEEKEQQKQVQINNLTMTALDFVTLLRNAGVTAQEIKAYLDANIDLDMQLKYCQNVYCGVVRQLLPISIGELTITDEMVVNAFKLKNGIIEQVQTEPPSIEELIPEEESEGSEE